MTLNLKPPAATKARSASAWLGVAMLPVAATLLLAVTLFVERSAVVFESPMLLAVLNTAFLCGIPLLLAYEATVSHRRTQVLGFLFVGSGLVTFGVSSLYAGWVMPLARDPNPTVTVHNLGCLLSGGFQVAGAHLFLVSLAGNEPHRWFAVAGLLFLEIGSSARTSFAYWYGLGLWLIAIGLTCVLLQRNVGSLIGWLGRGSQYLGCLYLAVAFLLGRKHGKTTASSVTGVQLMALWPEFEHRIEERTAELEKRVKDRTHELMRVNQQLADDIAKRKELEGELLQQARVDMLTGLYNRRHFFELAEQEMARATRYGAPVAAMMLDLDHFKAVNDNHGHHVGDLVLKRLGEVCTSTLRTIDIVGRLGGEEFAVLMPQTRIEQALEVAERLRVALSASPVALPASSEWVHITVSIGATALSTNDRQVEDLLRRADQALYAAKASGRNRVATHTDVSPATPGTHPAG